MINRYAIIQREVDKRTIADSANKAAIKWLRLMGHDVTDDIDINDLRTKFVNAATSGTTATYLCMVNDAGEELFRLHDTEIKAGA